MWNMILVSLVVAVAPGVDLQTLDAERVQGRLVALDAQRVVLETADGRRSLAVADLMSLKPSAAPRSAAPLPIAIDLKIGQVGILRIVTPQEMLQRAVAVRGHQRLRFLQVV